MSKIFLSYHSVDPDEGLAQHLHDCLRRLGHEVFIYKTLQLGSLWQEEIDANLRSSQYLLVLLSKASIESSMVQEEVRGAHKYGGVNPKNET